MQTRCITAWLSACAIALNASPLLAQTDSPPSAQQTLDEHAIASAVFVKYAIGDLCGDLQMPGGAQALRTRRAWHSRNDAAARAHIDRLQSELGAVTPQQQAASTEASEARMATRIDALHTAYFPNRWGDDATCAHLVQRVDAGDFELQHIRQPEDSLPAGHGSP